MTDERLLPLFPLHVVLFPGLQLPLNVFEERYKLMMAHCLEADRLFGVVLIRAGEEVGGPTEVHSMGTTARIQGVEPLPGGRMNLLAVGERRFQLASPVRHEPYPQATARLLLPPPGGADHSLVERVATRFKSYLEAFALLSGQGAAFNPQAEVDELARDAERFSFQVGGALRIDLRERQRLLEATSVEERLQREARLLRRETDLLRLMASAGRREDSLGAFSRN